MMSNVTTKVLSTQSKAEFDRAVEAAAACLREGEVIGIPSETVYGLAGNAFSAEAVQTIFAVKGRPATNPLIVHVADWAMVEQCSRVWDDAAAKLAKAFWPGPLTLVVERSSRIPPEVTAGGETVALRWPSHPLMQAVIKAAGFPLAAPSANRSNALSPTQAQHVLGQLDGMIPLVIDGGHSAVGIESTVVDLVSRPARILRPGMVQREALVKACDFLSWETPGLNEAGLGAEGVHRSPGHMKLHYSPKARLQIASWSNESALVGIVNRSKVPKAAVSVISYGRIPEGSGFARVSVIPDDAEAYARALFSELHLCDESGSALIIVEAPPESSDWEGVWDRLQRAATED